MASYGGIVVIDDCETLWGIVMVSDCGKTPYGMIVVSIKFGTYVDVTWDVSV